MGNIFNRCCFAFLFSFFVTFSHAETIPATLSGSFGYVITGEPDSAATDRLSAFSRFQAKFCPLGSAASNGWKYGVRPATGYSPNFTDGTTNEPYGTAYPHSYDINCYTVNDAGDYKGWAYNPNKIKRVGPYYSCPSSDWQLQGANCVRPDCAAGYDRDAQGRCVKNCTSKAGVPTVNGNYEFSGAVSNWSVGGCKVKCGQRVLAQGGGAGYNCTFTGASAEPDNPEAKALPPDPTKLPPENPRDCLNQGQGYIQTSSGVTCVSGDKAPEGQKPEKFENDESKESGTDKNGDGKPDQDSPDWEKRDKTTSTENGKTKSEETITKKSKDDGSGNKTCESGFTLSQDGLFCTKKTVTEQDTPSFCKTNPDDPACKSKQGSWSGSCQSGFACDGDPVTCAIARANWDARCEMAKGSGGLIDEQNPGGTEAQKQAGENALNKDGSNDFNIAEAFQSKNQAWVNFSSGCPIGDQEYRIKDAVIKVNASIVCDIGYFVRLLVHIVAYMGLAGLFARKMV